MIHSKTFQRRNTFQEFKLFDFRILEIVLPDSFTKFDGVIHKIFSE